MTLICDQERKEEIWSRSSYVESCKCDGKAIAIDQHPIFDKTTCVFELRLSLKHFVHAIKGNDK